MGNLFPVFGAVLSVCLIFIIKCYLSMISKCAREGPLCPLICFVFVFVFFLIQVDDQQLHLNAEDIENLDAAKLSRFIHMNNLHWVTEYSPMIAAGLFNTMVQTHLLLMMKKTSPEYEESMRRYREAAKLFQGQILFVLVDSGKRENGKVMSYFKLKESQLPALAIYESVDDKWDTLPIAEVTVEKVRGFCEGFLKGLLQRDLEAEGDSGKEEL